jgi:hypothetical protein
LFETPDKVFPEEMLRPEKQDIEAFAAGVEAIVDTQVRVARTYFEDGSVGAACPPLKALLHVMVHGTYEGLSLDSPRFRELFRREALLSSSWYRERLVTKQQRDVALCKRRVSALEAFASSGISGLADLEQRLGAARELHGRVSAPGYLNELVGTLGADPFHLQLRR